MRKKKQPRVRMAQLVAETVAVICPACGEYQPAFGGSEFWTEEDFIQRKGLTGVRPCVSCDVPLIVETTPKVQLGFFSAADKGKD